jgi:hypothetical protein
MKKKADPTPKIPKPVETKMPAIVDEASLLSDLRSLIRSARQRIAAVAKATYTQLCWQVGRRVLRENLQAGRAAYGKEILATVSQELTAEFGQAFTLRALYRAIQLYQCFADEAIVSTLSTQLSWSHFIELLPIKDPLARDFYSGFPIRNALRTELSSHHYRPLPGIEALQRGMA